MIYLAAPYSASSKEEIKKRMQIFSQVAADLIKNGAVVVSPLFCHYIRDYGDLPGDWNYWQHYSRTLLAKCSELVIVRIDGWENSIGVQEEIEFAKQNQIPCRFVDPLK